MVDWEHTPELMTLAEVADVLRLAPRSCHNMLSQGRFPILPFSFRPYRFRSRDLRAYLDQRTIVGGSRHFGAARKALRRA